MIPRVLAKWLTEEADRPHHRTIHGMRDVGTDVERWRPSGRRHRAPHPALLIRQAELALELEPVQPKLELAA